MFWKFDLGLEPCKSHFLPRTDYYLWKYVCHPRVIIAVGGYFQMFLTQKDIIKCYFCVQAVYTRKTCCWKSFYFISRLQWVVQQCCPLKIIFLLPQSRACDCPFRIKRSGYPLPLSVSRFKAGVWEIREQLSFRICTQATSSNGTGFPSYNEATFPKTKVLFI